ncbi:MAG: UDP-glucose 4-epimerase GalE [Desulfovibrionaceae bacterium]|nr:UDP-glucose 4-epimerase GalE [Desulfovibrionaceae bacterium]
MNILVIGGAGFIGSHTCYALEEKGYTPIIYDNFSSGYKDLISPFQYVEGDIHDVEHLESVLRDYDIKGVLHFAAYISVKESVEDPLSYYTNNLCGSINLFSAIQRAGVRYVVLSSSASVYGKPVSYNPISEDASMNPMSPYAQSKYMMERIAEDCSQAYDLYVASLRYFNAAGADAQGRTGQRRKEHIHILACLFASLVGDIPYFSLYGSDYATPDGTCIRDYIHVTDLAYAHVNALEYLMREKKNITCNLGTNKGTSNREMIRIVEEVTGKKVTLKEEARRQGDPDYVVADATRAFELLSWKPSHSSLENIVHTGWEWFIKDRKGSSHG